MRITQHFRKRNNKLIWVISYSFIGFEVFIKVPAIIIIRFGENNVRWPIYIDIYIYQFLWWANDFYSSRPGSALDFTNVRLIFMNDSFIKCVSSILKYLRNVLITEEN